MTCDLIHPVIFPIECTESIAYFKARKVILINSQGDQGAYFIETLIRELKQSSDAIFSD